MLYISNDASKTLNRFIYELTTRITPKHAP